MATVKEAVKESLVGTTIEPQLSQQARATFQKHARKDESGEAYMTEEDFVNAIAPENEDYVSAVDSCHTNGSMWLIRFSTSAQDKTRTICHLVSRC